MITIRNLHKKYDSFTALEDLEMNIPSGSIYGLIGTNGAGKTTLIRHMAGVLCPDSGEILYDGDPVWENNALKSRIGLIPDELFFPAGATLDSMSKLYSGWYDRWNEDRFRELVTAFRLNPKTRLKSFSKGMQKQAAFSLTLGAQPDYLLLDEPIDGLDPIIRKLVWKFIVDDVAAREMTVLVSSHNLREMEGLCDTIGILSRGHMVLEKDYDLLRGDLNKVQVSFGNKVLPTDPYEGLNILHRESRGTVDLLVVNGKREEIEHHLNTFGPVLLDMLPLTLEEIFIYELGGDDHEISELLF